MQWVRLQERFRHKIKNNDELADGYNFNFRIRYNILLQFPFGKKPVQPGTFSFVFSDEVFVNFGKQIVVTMYDQKRFFAGFHYHVNRHDNLQFGYMNICKPLAAGNQYRSTQYKSFLFHYR